MHFKNINISIHSNMPYEDFYTLRCVIGSPHEAREITLNKQIHVNELMYRSFVDVAWDTFGQEVKQALRELGDKSENPPS